MFSRNDSRIMLAWLYLLVVVWVLAPAPTFASPISVQGTVFLDANGDGVRTDGEPGIADVEVSDGIQVTRTDAAGHYRIARPAAGDKHCVFVIVPTGYRISKTFYRPSDNAAETLTNDFGLVRSADGDRADFSFAQITDLHVESAQAASELVSDLKEMESLNPAFVIATGDLVNRGLNKEEFKFYKQALQQTPLRIVNVIGNHELIGDSGANYVSALGPLHYAFNYGGRHFVVLNSCSDTANQLAWLKAELALQPKDQDTSTFFSTIRQSRATWMASTHGFGPYSAAIGTRAKLFPVETSCMSIPLRYGSAASTPVRAGSE